MDNVKKLLASLACLIALLGAVGITASAKDSRVDALTLSARESYTASLARSGKESFHGHCGNMVSNQLYQLGINSWFVSGNGNDLFDYYADMEQTSGGYYIKPCYLEDYSMEQALNFLCENGTKDVYNILVGFQRTNTEAGSKYGHAVLINGILDGTVYFVESFDFFLNGMHAEGDVVACSIADFAAYYANWATYEGLVWFAEGYADACCLYGTNLQIETTLDAMMRSAPCDVGENGCEPMENVTVGTQLHATALVVNTQGDRFYRVAQEEAVGYIAETSAQVKRVNPEDLSVIDLNIPSRIARGGALKMAGAVESGNSRLTAVQITVSDMQGRVLLSQRQEGCEDRQELRKLSLQLETQFLPEGAYLVQVYGESAHCVPSGQELGSATTAVRLAAQMLLVGKQEYDGEIQPVLTKVPVTIIEKKADA